MAAVPPSVVLRITYRAVLAAALASAGTLVGASTWSAFASRGRVVAAASAPARDVAIVFGAQVFPSGVPAPYTRARLDLAAELLREGRARVLLVSGDDRAAHNHETSAMRRYLEARGVPASRIVEDPAGVDTYDTCVRARDVFGVREALLVSQEYHLPRAVATCRALGVDAMGVADTSVKGTTAFWPKGVAREFPASVKMVWDLVTRRPPLAVDAPSAAVRDALAA